MPVWATAILLHSSKKTTSNEDEIRVLFMQRLVKIRGTIALADATVAWMDESAQ
jgi:hypothetical protein